MNLFSIIDILIIRIAQAQVYTVIGDLPSTRRPYAKLVNKSLFDEKNKHLSRYGRERVRARTLIQTPMFAHKNGCARQNTLFSRIRLHLKISHQIVNVTRSNNFS